MPINPNLSRKLKQEEPVEETNSPSLFDEEDEEEEVAPKGANDRFNKIIIGCVLAGIAVTAIILVVAYARGSFGEEGPSPETPAVESEVGARGDQVPWLNGTVPSTGQDTSTDWDETPVSNDRVDGVIVPGITDISGDTVNQNTTVVSSDNFVKDLNSLPVNEFYQIEEIYTTVDFISYEKKRAITDEGIELYWLEALYKGKKAKVQVPFRIFKELDEVGVTVVDVEVVRVRPEQRGVVQEIVTGFSVNPDYKKILEQSRR